MPNGSVSPALWFVQIWQARRVWLRILCDREKGTRGFSVERKCGGRRGKSGSKEGFNEAGRRSGKEGWVEEFEGEREGQD